MSIAQLSTLWKNPFIRHNLVFFVGSIAVGGLNYMYYPVLARLLEPSAFGEVQALVSLFLQLSIFLTVLGMVTVNVVANYDSKARRNQVIFEFEKLALWVSIAALLLVTVLHGPVQQYLHFASPWPFFVLMTGLAASIPLTFRGSFLRGKKKFGLASLANLLAAGGKLALSVCLVLLGLGTIGAIAGVVVAQLAASVLVIGCAARLGLHNPALRSWFKAPDFKLLMPELKYGAFVLVCSLVVTLQYSLDIVVVKHYFDAHTAGLYAGVASVARIIFFATASVSLVLMPSVRIKAKVEENTRLLYKSLGMLAAAGGPVLAISMLWPQWVTRILMGHEYLSYAHLLPRLSLAIFVVSIINLLVTYFMALRRFFMVIIVIIGAAITYGLMAFHHASLSAIVDSILIGSIIMMCLLGIWVGSSKIKRFL